MQLPLIPTRRHALYRAAGVRELDRVAIEVHAIPGIDLMEAAGAAAWREIAASWPATGRLAVLCGPGNNGGDGFVVARLAAAAGVDAQAWLLGDATRVAGDAARALGRLRAAGGELRPLAEFDPGAAEVVVDALFGTGLTRELDGDIGDLVRRVNAAAAVRVAVDIPSGLSADTGATLGIAVQAHLTVSFIGLKQGLFTGDARDCCGEVVLADLDVPEPVYAEVPVAAWRVSADDLAGILAPRRRRDHKGRFGHVLVVGGDHGFAGAARLCAEAAARAGAGLVSVATRPRHVAAIAGARPELMARGVRRARELRPLLEAASVVAVGPGLGRGEWGAGLLREVLRAPVARVLDADALNLLADEPALAKRLRRAPAVVTPHPGEAGRLLGCTTAQVEADRFASVRELAERLGCVALLKGAGTLVHVRGQAPRVIDGGNPGMASGGMGDLLTGLVAGLMAQGLSAHDAAVAAAAMHASAGDAAAGVDGERGLLAGDLLPHLRRLANRL
jgi:NAD(P)H-hydrate epimerase